MIQIYQRTIKDKNLKHLSEFRVGSWIYVVDPTAEELEQLAVQYRVSQDLLKDALDPYEVPRMEIDDSRTYIFTRVPKEDQQRVKTIPLLVIVGEDFLLTISKEELAIFHKFIGEQISYYTTQKIKFFLQIFSQINSAYNNFLTYINRRVRALAVRVEEIADKDIVQFVRFEEILNDFLGALIPTNTILNNLLAGRFLTLFERDKDLVEDLMLANNQLIEACRANLRNMANIREAYATIMTNNLNRVIKFLTALTIIFSVPTFIASLYGMNVHLPLADSPMAFFLILAGIVVISLLLLVIFYRKKWL